MSTSYLVRFDGVPVPTRDDVCKLLEDFIGAGGKVRWADEQDRFYVDLVGTYSDLLRRLDDTCAQLHEYLSKERDGSPRPRWIEVWLGDGCIDVMTRQADDFTHWIAHGIAWKIARFWDGSYTPPD